MLFELFKAFFSIFVVMDPFGSVPLFISVVKKNSARAALYATGIAALVLFIFLFFGHYIFTIFGVEFYSFKIAGGVLLFILSTELVLGMETVRSGRSPALLLIGTPMLTGPGVMATTVVLVKETGYLVTAIASALALLASFFVLLSSRFLARLLGGNGVEILSRMVGILLGAIAVEFVATGVREAWLSLSGV